MIDPGEFKNLVAGASGSAVAAWVARATGWALFGMFCSGWMAAYFIGPLIVEWTNLSHQASGVGFVVGFLAIIVMRKTVATIESFPAESMGGVILSRLKKWMGVE